MSNEYKNRCLFRVHLGGTILPYIPILSSSCGEDFFLYFSDTFARGSEEWKFTPLFDSAALNSSVFTSALRRSRRISEDFIPLIEPLV